jgi:molybdopterin/thiamine biosynthesis adenylyltransferase
MSTNWLLRLLPALRSLSKSTVVRTVRTIAYRRKRFRLLPRLFDESSPSGESLQDRQQRIAGFDQPRLSNAHVALIGAGMNGEVAEGLVRKGVGTLTIVDFDEVSWTNFNRQFFFRHQEGMMKAHALAENLVPHATSGTLIHSLALRLGAALDAGLLDLSKVDVLVVAVDNTATRIEASVAARDICPVVFAALDLAGEAGYVAVQLPGEACYGCILPHGLEQLRLPCAAPSIKDTAKHVGGMVLYAIDSILMPRRKRCWNYHELHMAGFLSSWSRQFPRRLDCPLCNEQSPAT